DRVLDPAQFLAEHGLRALSREHREHPFEFATAPGEVHRVVYEPGESTTYLFGGNSNWRGPIWFPVNHMLVESLREYYRHFGKDFTVPLPGEPGRSVTLCEAADLITDRLTSLFLPDATGRRPVHGTEELYTSDPNFRDLILFYEYFHGENGRGVGASHQTGWTALVATLLAHHGPRGTSP
ncbi:MAG: glucosidase, partial [Myxococcota bacterium]